MPSSPPQLSIHSTDPLTSRHDGVHGEMSPLLPRRSSGVPKPSSGNHRRSPRGAAPRDLSGHRSDVAASAAAASSLSASNSAGSEPSCGDVSSSGGHRSRTRIDESSVKGGSDGSVFSTPPTSLAGFVAVLAHSVALQSWTSYILAVAFHLFHVLLLFSFFVSPILFRSTMFSSQTMARALLEAQDTVSRHGGTNASGAAPLPSPPVSIESVWSIHDAVFFLEPGHVVMPTAIGNSFSSLRRKKKNTKGDERGKQSSKGGRESAEGDGAGADARGDGNDSHRHNDGEDVKGGHGDTHAYVVPHGNSRADGEGGRAEKLLAATSRVSTLAVRDADAAPVREGGRGGGRALFYNVVAPPPIVPRLPLSKRKSTTHGRATLSAILDAWEASPLYSSPLALTLYYYLYNIGCVLLLLAVTDGKLTGHFSVLRLIVSLAELLWYVQHGAHAFVIYCWMCLLSHWPRHAPYSAGDSLFLRLGTPYAVVSKKSGAVAMFWFYHPSGDAKAKVLVDAVNMEYYLYDQVWYLRPVASAVAVAYLVLLSLCIARDLHRMLDAVVGVRVLMQPEGCVRCPLCGELMEVCEQHRYRRWKSIYQSAREGTSSSVRRTMWWWRWVRSAVRGSGVGYRVPPPRLHSPLWCWLLPGWLGGGPQGVGEGSVPPEINGNTSLVAMMGDDAPYTMEDMREDIEFYEEAAVRRSAAAPQATMAEETAHLMRWLTVVPPSDASVAVPLKGQRCGSSSSDGEAAADVLGIGSSGPSSEDEVERGLVKAMPAGAGPTRHLPIRDAVAPREGMRSSTSPRSVPNTAQHGDRLPMRFPCSSSSNQQQDKFHRVRRFTGEVLYWQYATRHVHHRCPKLRLDAHDASDNEDDNTDSDDTNFTGSTSEASSFAGTPTGVAGATTTGGAASKDRRVTGTLAAPAASSTAASRAIFSDRGVRRSLLLRAAASSEGLSAHTPRASGAEAQRTTSAPPNSRHYGTIGPNFSEASAQLFAGGSQLEARAHHIAQRGVYDPVKDEEDEFRPGNAFQSFDRAGWLSRLTYSWLNPLLTFGLLEPTLLRQECFLPALPESLLSLDNIAVPAWQLWVHRKMWYPKYVAKPGELLIPSNEALERAEEHVMSFADLHNAEMSDDADDAESSQDRQAVVILGHTSLSQAAKLRPQPPKRSWEERVFWSVTAPIRCVLVLLFYYAYVGASRTVGRTRRRLVRELLKDRLVAAAMDMYDENGYQAMEANEALDEATWALAEMASSCGSSAVAPSAGSALPTHMRRQLALSDVSLYHLFLEHRCGRRFLLIAAPLLVLSELLTLSVVPVLVIFVQYLQKVDAIDMLPGRRGTPGDQANVSAALLLAALMGVLLLLHGVVQGAYVSQVQQVAMEARTCIRAMVLEKTLALPLAQRTFSESEVLALATEEATRVARCLVSLHHTWSCPLRVVLLSLLLAYYVGWTAGVVACVGPLFMIRWLRHALHGSRQSRHTAEMATKVRLSLLQLVLGHIREVKGMLLEGRLMRRLRRAREAEAAYAEGVAMAEGTVGMLSGGVAGLLMVVALGAECVVSEKALREVDVLIPTLVIFFLLAAPLLELPTLFAVVARGFLSMKRIEAFLRQTPDRFVGTWVDLAAFSALQQQLRRDNPGSALLQYHRGSVVCRGSSFTWQHDLTEESPMTLLRVVDMCIEPGQLVVVQGSMGSGKSTLLLSILGEVNRCVTAKDSDDGRGSSAADYESESFVSVVSASEAAAADDVFVASPTVSGDGYRRPRASDSSANNDKTGGSASAEAALSRIATTAAARNDVQRVQDDAKIRTASSASRSNGHSTACPMEASQLTPASLEDGEGTKGGFLLFGSCAYCAEAPWLQNDTIRANIMSSGGPAQLGRWYNTVLRACALHAEVAALPQGDATVVGDRGELLSLSMRCRIALARAVYSKSHVYLFDSILSPLEPTMQEHIIQEVIHKLLRKRTVILVSNAGLRSLRPHRVFSVVEGGMVREDTELYKAVPSLDARSDESEGDNNDAENDVNSDAGESSRRTPSSRGSSGGADQGSVAPPLPTLYAEEFEAPQEAGELPMLETFNSDPMAAATALLFDGGDGFGPRDPLFSELDDHHDSTCNEERLSKSLFGSRSGLNSVLLRSRRTMHGSSPYSPPRPDSQQRSWSTAGWTSPGTVTLLTPASPLQGAAASPDASIDATASSPHASTSLQHASSSSANGVPSDTPASDAHNNACGEVTATTSGGASSCSTGQYIQDHYAQQLERERMLRHRHRLSFFIFLRFMGGQVTWLVFTTVLQQFVHFGIDMWAAVWLAVMSSASSGDSTAAATSNGGMSTSSTYAKVWGQLCTWIAVTDTVFLAAVSALTVLTMVLTLLRTRAVYVGVYGTMHFIYNQIARRIVHAPASYFDSRIIALLTRVLESDAEVAEYRVPGTAEVLLSCAVQVFFIAAWNAFVSPIFVLLLPVTISLFYHIVQRHAVVLREVRKLEVGSVSGMADILREVYQGAATVRCMALQDRLREEYCRALDTANTASMVAYMVDRWVELRLHVLTALAVCAAAMLGVVFTFSYSRPSLTAVAMIAALRAGPVMHTMCQSFSRFEVSEWISVQRLMSLWSVPQEPLTREGDADLYTYSHARRRAVGFQVGREGGQDALRLDVSGTSIDSPKALASTALPLLELRDVSARYRTTLPYVLRHVRLAVYPRERLGVVGHAGQGKGSIFNVLMRLVDVIEGDGVFINGENAARVPYPVLRGWFSLIPQEPLLVHGSWRSNLLAGYHPAHPLFMEDDNDKSDCPNMPTVPAFHSRQQPQRDGGVHTRTATAAVPTSYLGAGQQVEPTSLVPAGNSTESLPVSYGTDNARAFTDRGDGQRGVRCLDGIEADGLSHGLPGDRSSVVTPTLARATRRLRDKSSLPHRHRHRRSTSGGGRPQRPLSGDAEAARDSSTGGGDRPCHHRRRRSRRLACSNSRAASGHLVEGPRQPMEEAALWDALRAVGLDAAVEFDGGLDAPLAGGDVSETDLTASQCRLLCLARAVLNKSPIVLLEDSVVSGAEAQTDRAIRRVLANELRDSTVIIIAHRMSTVLNVCTRVVAMHEGALLPIADLRDAVLPVTSSSQPDEGARAHLSSTASLTDMATPTLAANIHPDVLRKLSYYVE